MSIELYDRVELKSGHIASIVEVFDDGKAFIVDVDRDDDIYTEEVTLDEIKSIISTSADMYVINCFEKPADNSSVKLKEFYGMTVDITGTDGRCGIGKVTDYIFPEDNENDMESIIVDFPDGTALEFYQSDIKSIRIIQR